MPPLRVPDPLAATERAGLRLLAELEAVHGPVRHILLPTVALEHKYFAGAFANARPSAQLWVAPFEYSFPIDLPLWAQGFPLGTRVLPDPAAGEEPPEWAAQLPYKLLGPIAEKVGGFQEVVCFDKPTASLLVTDLVCAVSAEPPEALLRNDKRALLFHARDSATDAVEATEEAETKGFCDKELSTNEHTRKEKTEAVEIPKEKTAASKKGGHDEEEGNEGLGTGVRPGRKEIA